jgi:(methylthio)acryloyl-CoA hydratase
MADQIFEFLQCSFHGQAARGVLHIALNRPVKRNAISDALIAELMQVFSNVPDNVGAIVLSGNGDHFCAGLDLSDLRERDASEGILHSMGWHSTFERIQYGRVPVVAALHGAVVGGGLELASAAHIRVADQSTYYGLPEGQRGIFVGGSGAVRIPRLIGVARMTDMMLTGRTYAADEGVVMGFSQYAVPKGEALSKAMELATKIAANAKLSNFAVMHALPRIADQSLNGGLFTEALMASIAGSSDDARSRVRAFLDGKAGKVTNQNSQS